MTASEAIAPLVLDLVRREAGLREHPFVVIDLEDIKVKVEAWRRLLPRVEPFYAVKCNDDERILAEMVRFGVGFDCASKDEIDAALRAGAKAEQIVFAHPCKPRSHVEHAKAIGVPFTTFDNLDELDKIKKLYPHVQLLLRLLPDDSSAVCRLSNKFGADIEAVPGLLRRAKELDLDVVGVSFHVGSGATDPNAFSEAVKLAEKAFAIAESLHVQMTVLDVGGGFPGDAVDQWDDLVEECDAVGEGKFARAVFPIVADKLRASLDQLFPPSRGVRIIAEPGRYMVHSAVTLAANIIGRRRTPAHASSCDTSLVEQDHRDNAAAAANTGAGQPFFAKHEAIRYYIDDGVYGSFNNLIYDHATIRGFPFRPNTPVLPSQGESKEQEDNGAGAKQAFFEDKAQEDPAVASIAPPH